MKRTLLTLLVCMAHLSNSQDDAYLPSGSGFDVVKHNHYVLGYSEKHEQPLWVAYELTKEELIKSVDRTDNFRIDPMVNTGSATLDDYKGSGLDRGHLAPAADFVFSSSAMSESFYMSNMSPQIPNLNRGAWKSLESAVRQWAESLGGVYVVTGPILRNKDDVQYSIGRNKVSVPWKYYKIVYSENSEQAIGFVFWNLNGASKDRKLAAKSVDQIEEMTGLDFFSSLPNELQRKIESGYSYAFWNGRLNAQTSSSSSRSSSSLERVTTSVRCQGIAVSTGVQCKNMTLNANKHCHHHQSQIGKSKAKSKSKSYSSGRCTATTKAGSRCKRSAASGRTRCWQH